MLSYAKRSTKITDIFYGQHNNALEYGVPQDRERIILIGISNTVLKDNPIVKAKSGTIPSFPWHHAIVHDMDVVKNMPWPGEENFQESGFRPVPGGYC